MSDIQAASGAPLQESSGSVEVTTENPSGSGQVSYDSHAKLLSEKKALAAKYKAIEDKFQALQGQQLQSEGKKDEYIKHLEEQLSSERETRLNDKATYAHRTLSERIVSVANRMGCVDPDAILKLADLERVSMGEDLSIDDTSVKLMMEDMKKSRPYLFRTQTIPTKDGTPVASMDRLEQQSKKPEKSPLEMNTNEFDSAFRDGMRKALDADPI